MLLMFAVGVGSLVGMAALTGVMVIEKTHPKGRRIASIVGIVLLAWGALVLLQPDWLPTPLLGAESTTPHGQDHMHPHHH
jgi:cytochrome c biogenesis protein CcdA